MAGSRLSASSRAPRTPARWRYLKLWGLAAGGWQMGRAALIAADQLAAGSGDSQISARNKIATARFYADALLPQAAALAQRSSTAARARSRWRPSGSDRDVPVTGGAGQARRRRRGTRRSLQRNTRARALSDTRHEIPLPGPPPRGPLALPLRFCSGVAARSRSAAAAHRSLYAVGCSNVAQDFSRVPPGESAQGLLGGDADGNGTQRFMTDLLVDPARARRTSSSDPGRFGLVRVVSRAGTMSYVLVVCYPTDRFESARRLRAADGHVDPAHATRRRGADRSSATRLAGGRCSRTASAAARSPATTSKSVEAIRELRLRDVGVFHGDLRVRRSRYRRLR